MAGVPAHGSVRVGQGAGVSTMRDVEVGVGVGVGGPPEAITPHTPPMTATAAAAIAKKCHFCHPSRPAAFTTARF